MTTSDDVARRLDRVIAILQLAHHDEIEQARARIRADELNAAILEAAAKPVPAGELMSAVRAAVESSPSTRTVSRRIASLVSQGVLEQSGSGPSISYEATGLV